MENLLRDLLKRFLPIFLVFLSASLFITRLQMTEVNAETITITKTFSSLTYDGYVAWWNEDYWVARNSATGSVSASMEDMLVGQYYGGPEWGWEIHRMFVPFDTSSIPSGATILSANLSIKVHVDESGGGGWLIIMNGQPTYPHLPMVPEDYYTARYSGMGGNISIASLSEGNYYNITLSSQGLGWINTNGYTKLCIRHSWDINGANSTSTDRFFIYTAEKGEASSPKLYVEYQTGAYQYILHGAYSELGELLTCGINVTMYRETQAPVPIFLNGTVELSSESVPICLKFDLGYNESRVYYLKDAFEEIYVVLPSEPYYSYFFELVDLLGIHNAYFETSLHINGTDRIVERWRCDIVNDMPFTLSWGTAYKVRLVCDEGNYLFGAYAAGATTSFTFVVSSEMFPQVPTDTSGLAIAATRQNSTWIQIYFDDVRNKTLWVNVAIHEFEYGTIVFSQNTTSYPFMINFYDASEGTDYYVNFTISHEDLGELIKCVVCPDLTIEENPFGFLRTLGDFPFDAAQLPAVLILIVVCFSFSWWNVPLGIVTTILVSFFLAWLGWLAIGWAWLCTSGFISAILVIAELKERER